ncbi:hypothetical protein HK104_002631 [Borealophlyctis nickersoniae]|nr:hypothetical protein HK104_002631 [Borealophlyctis nickersoniae]
MSDIVSIVSECKRLLTHLGSCTEEEARAAVTACDLWLTNNQNQKLSFKSGSANPSKTNRLPLEIVLYILRSIRGDGEDHEEVLKDQKSMLLACRLVNRKWREIAWRLFWYRVHVPTAYNAVQKVLHPWAVEALHGTQVRALYIKGNPTGLGPLLGTQSMGTIRILNIRRDYITRSQLLLVFENLPNLISLDASIGSEIENPDRDTLSAKEESLWLTRQKKKDEIWHRGFGNLKALAFYMGTASVRSDLLGRMAVSMGPKVESLDIFVPDGTPWGEKLPGLGGLDSFFSKIGPKCRNLKSFTAPAGLAVSSIRSLIHSQLVHLSLLSVECDKLIEHVIETCVNLKYLELEDCPGDAKAVQHLANGPFLHGFRISESEDSEPLNHDTFLSLLTQRGSSLRTLGVWQTGQDDRWLHSVAKAAPNLRQLAMHGDTKSTFISAGLITFFHLATKLTHFHIDPSPPYKYGAEVAEVANDMGIYLGDDDILPYAAEVSEVANDMGITLGDDDIVVFDYVQSMEDEWIGV